MPYFPKSGDSWIYPYPNVGPLWEIPIDGYLWVLSSPRIPREHQLNTMGTLLGGHPNCPLRSSKSITKWFLWNPKRTKTYDAPDSLCLITYTHSYICIDIMLLIHFLIFFDPGSLPKKNTKTKCLLKKKSKLQNRWCCFFFSIFKTFTKTARAVLRGQLSSCRLSCSAGFGYMHDQVGTTSWGEKRATKPSRWRLLMTLKYVVSICFKYTPED